MALSFEQAKASLKKTNSNGQSVYEHMSALILKLLKDNPDDPLALFENISVQVKERQLRPKVLTEGGPLIDKSTSKVQVEQWIESIHKMFPKVSSGIQQDEPDAVYETPPNARINDIIDEASLLEWANVRLDRTEIVQITMSIQQLAQLNPNITSIRLFGKVLGIKKDYIVVETKLSEYGDAPDNFEVLKAESPGKGANEHVYFVTNNPGDVWIKLPDVIPEQIIIAQSTRRFLTGDLSSSVQGLPHFKWNEASYLRALVEIIASDTVISPTGYYVRDEDNALTLVENNEFQPVPPLELQSLEKWVHHRRRLLKQGRIDPWIKPETQEEDENVEKVEEVVEEAIPPLQSLSEDGESSANEWGFRMEPRLRGGNANGITIVRSMKWPGAVTVAKGRRFCSIYVGNGLKQLSIPFSPPLPHAFAKEYKDSEEEPKIVEQQDVLAPISNGESEEVK